jgi:predicted deacylase
MVNQSAIMRDAIGLLEDVAKQGFLQRAWDKLGRRTKAVIKGAQDMYVAEDDGWKTMEFFNGRS